MWTKGISEGQKSKWTNYSTTHNPGHKNSKCLFSPMETLQHLFVTSGKSGTPKHCLDRRYFLQLPGWQRDNSGGNKNVLISQFSASIPAGFIKWLFLLSKQLTVKRHWLHPMSPSICILKPALSISHWPFPSAFLENGFSNRTNGNFRGSINPLKLCASVNVNFSREMGLQLTSHFQRGRVSEEVNTRMN